MCYASIIEINQVGERVMKSERSMSKQASAAKMIKKELKQLFPNTKFIVTSQSGTCFSSVEAEWMDGPHPDVVEDVTKKYQYGHFDGMEDIYRHSNVLKDIPQVTWVNTRRNISDDACKKAFDLAKNVDGVLNGIESLESDTNIIESTLRDRISGYGYILRKLREMDLTNGFNLDEYIAISH